MRVMYRYLLLLVVSALTAGCVSMSQNVPVARNFPQIVDRPIAASVFIDQNGTFYGDNWMAITSRDEILHRGSLLNATSGDGAARTRVAQAEERLLESIRDMVADKGRVVIVTHGYNNSPAEAGEAFDLIEQRISWRPDDVLIRVYWDGMIGSNGGELPIWFAATGASQLVGSRGLRRLLNLFESRDVTLISHSRGASVLLSALSNPVYSYEFRETTTSLDFANSPDFLKPPPLEDNANRLNLILLAPAVGFPDFWGLECEQTRKSEKRCNDTAPSSAASSSRGASRCRELRNFPSQLYSISYTVNRGDSVLRKKVGNLRRYFNATDLGYDAAIGQRVASCYPGLTFRVFPLADEHAHPYVLYAQDPELASMLRATGLDIQR